MRGGDPQQHLLDRAILAYRSGTALKATLLATPRRHPGRLSLLLSTLANKPPLKLWIMCSVRGDKEYERAKNSAIGSLSLRPHSRVQLENKLEHKGYSKSAIAKALDRLAELVCASCSFSTHFCQDMQTSDQADILMTLIICSVPMRLGSNSSDS